MKDRAQPVPGQLLGLFAAPHSLPAAPGRIRPHAGEDGSQLPASQVAFFTLPNFPALYLDRSPGRR